VLGAPACVVAVGVERVTDDGDTITEGSAGGTDTVRSSVTWTLGVNVENLTLTGNSGISGIGNAAANTITGNSGNNILNGAGGTDTLIGLAGDDTYVIDAGGTITEASNGGTDTVRTSATLTLGANLENLILIGGFAISGTGHAGTNTITGNAGNNTLNGAGGSDTFIGGFGSDTFITDGDDTIIEASNPGTDTVRSSATFTLGANLENLILTGNSNQNATGNSAANTNTGTRTPGTEEATASMAGRGMIY
jgi:serralysin